MSDHPWGRADLMATAAVRYCLGRSSYIVGDCVDWLLANWERFEPGCRLVILRDISEAIQRDDEARERGDQYLPLGMDMDRREWERAAAEIGRAWGAPTLALRGRRRRSLSNKGLADSPEKRHNRGTHDDDESEDRTSSEAHAGGG